MTQLKQVKKILKDNEDTLRMEYSIAGEIEDINYEEKYNFFTKRNVLIFFDSDVMNGNAKSICKFIANKLSENTNRIYRVYEKASKLHGCYLYKVE